MFDSLITMVHLKMLTFIPPFFLLYSNKHKCSWIFIFKSGDFQKSKMFFRNNFSISTNLKPSSGLFVLTFIYIYFIVFYTDKATLRIGLITFFILSAFPLTTFPLTTFPLTTFQLTTFQITTFQITTKIKEVLFCQLYLPFWG